MREIRFDCDESELRDFMMKVWRQFLQDGVHRKPLEWGAIAGIYPRAGEDCGLDALLAPIENTDSKEWSDAWDGHHAVCPICESSTRGMLVVLEAERRKWLVHEGRYDEFGFKLMRPISEGLDT